MNKELPKYVNGYVIPRFHWMMAHTPRRLRDIWDSGEFENYFSKIIEEGEIKTKRLLEGVVRDQRHASQIAAMLLEKIPEGALTEQEKQDQIDIKGQKITSDKILGKVKQEMVEARVFFWLKGAPMLY